MNRYLFCRRVNLLFYFVIVVLISGCWFSSESTNDAAPPDQETVETPTTAADLENDSIVFEEPDLLHKEETLPEIDEQKKTHPAPIAKSKPLAAIIIDDMGYHEKIGQALLGLDLPLSFAFLPHAPFAAELEENAYQKGSDIMVHVPMEAGARWDPGPGTLYLAASPEDQIAILQDDLKAVPHATGANNHMGSKFTRDREAMHRVLGELQKQKLFFIDSFTTAESTGLSEAVKMGIKTNRRHIFLDNVQDREKICLQLEKLAVRAQKQDQAIAIGHPYQATLDALRDCGDKLRKTVRIVPVHELVK
jgi:polysaccharide deacetylase 2 family uncharacterized protein YibQ